ncbi:MAG: transglycosylase domain-containing protein [Acidobacteria bacterium]|nr:transglycosylase domain-containing protein [Acidobacteriota bacterium]
MRRVFAPIILLGLVATGCWSYEQKDLVPEELPDQALTSFVYDRDGKLITELEAGENRVNKNIDEIPEVLQHAVVAIEDERFYLHNGWDLRGIVRAARTNVAAGGVEQGGSTITQQLIKNGFAQDLTECQDDDGTPTRTVWCKVQEINFARQFEDQFSKDFILEQYLNTIFFGSNAYGVQAASQEYFGKDVEDITLPEAALIAGLIQRPSGFNPYDFPEDSEKRRRLVLDRMLANDYITEAEFDDAVEKTVLGLVLPDVEEESSFFGAPAHMAHFVEEVKNWFLDNPDFGETREERERLLFQGGLHITTTIDSELQLAAQGAIYGPEGALADPAGPDGAAVTMDPSTGEVLVMVGGRNFFGDDDFARVNLATGSGRQAGSSMKPIALATYLADGGSVTDTYKAPSSITLDIGPGGPWKVKGGGSGATVSLIKGTQSSYNTVFAQLMLDIGPQRYAEHADELGLSRVLQPVPAAVLGSENVTMLEMASVYSTFSNAGFNIEPAFVTEITNSDGTILYEYVPQPQPVMGSDDAAQLSWVLEGVITGGTGTAAQLDGGRPAAGKTGTAQNFGDATFIGYTPQLATAVWVGFAENVIPMVPPLTSERVYGGSFPARIWREIMNIGHADLPILPFPPPPSSSTSTTEPVLPSSVRVPSVEGLTLSEAMELLSGTALRVLTVEIESNEFKPGTVITQSPAGGASVPGGSTVTLEIAAANDDRIEVPTLSGLTIGEATSRARGLGLRVNAVAEQEPGTRAGSNPGRVWQQEPNAGKVVERGTRVRLKYNPDGTEPPPTVTEPPTTTSAIPSTTPPTSTTKKPKNTAKPPVTGGG